jgi:hypothetical protein
MDLRDVRMPQPREHVGLALEPPHRGRRDEAAAHEFHRDRPARRFLLRLVDAAHPALADEPHDPQAAEVGAGGQFLDLLRHEAKWIRGAG